VQFRNIRWEVYHLWCSRYVNSLLAVQVAGITTIKKYLCCQSLAPRIPSESSLTMLPSRSGISDAYYCAECTRLEKDRDGCPKIVNLGASRTDLFYERRRLGASLPPLSLCFADTLAVCSCLPTFPSFLSHPPSQHLTGFKKG